jgi:hypothetical protein
MIGFAGLALPRSRDKTLRRITPGPFNGGTLR